VREREREREREEKRRERREEREIQRTTTTVRLTYLFYKHEPPINCSE
jgi:hypothetical protein